LYQRLQCRDKYFYKIKFVFFLYLRLSASSKESNLPLCIYFWYQTDSGVPNTSIYSAVSLASPYYNYLYSTASTTMICWRYHSNSVNTGSHLPRNSDVKTRKRRNVVGIDMIRKNRIDLSRNVVYFKPIIRAMKKLLLTKLPPVSQYSTVTVSPEEFIH
jgi:hypothetical protein